MFAWWGRVVVRLRWFVLAAAVVVLGLGATWGGGVFGDLISGGFDDPTSQSSRARDEITANLGRQDVDVLVLYTVAQGDPTAPARAVAAKLTGNTAITSVQPGPISTDGHATYLAIQLR